MLKNYNIIDGKIKIGLTCVDSEFYQIILFLYIE